MNRFLIDVAYRQVKQIYGVATDLNFGSREFTKVIQSVYQTKGQLFFTLHRTLLLLKLLLTVSFGYTSRNEILLVKSALSSVHFLGSDRSEECIQAFIKFSDVNTENSGFNYTKTTKTTKKKF